MKKTLVIFCFFLSLTNLMSQVSLLKDINVDSASSGVDALFNADGFAYFKYKNASGWYNILKTNGNVQGKVLPYDVEAITDAEYGEGLVYYTDGTHLWVTDVASGGFREIFFYGQPATDIYDLTYSGGTLWFSASSGGDRELFWSDSHAAEKIDVNPSGSSDPGYLTDFNGILYFRAYDGINGYELFKAEHLSPFYYTATLVKNIFPGNGSSYPTSLFAWNGNLYFSADDGVNGKELWKSNGTTAGTVMVSDILPGPGHSEPVGFSGLGGSIVLFMADNGTLGYELWRTNGTAAGTVLVKDICPGPEGSYPSKMTLVGGTAYFSAYTPDTGNELWKTNGTVEGTLLVKDIETGPSGSKPRNFSAGTTRIYFSAFNTATGYEPYSSMGTASSTKLMADIAPGPLDGMSKGDNGLSVGNTFVFPAQHAAIGKELWKSTGTPAGTKLLQDCLNGNSNPIGFTKSGDVLFFSAEIDSLGAELWKTDGTEAGTVLVRDIHPGVGNAHPNNFTDLNGLLIFSAISPGQGTEIWASDGTAAGTNMLKDIGDGWGGSKPRNLKKIGNSVYFGAVNSTTGVELWKTDGTPAGTVQVKDINPGPDASSPGELYDIGGGISLFMATTAGQGRELWKTDGTAAGTVLVRDIEVGPGSSIGYDYSDGAVLAGIFYFKASNGTQGNELWRSDGTEAGTFMVKDLNAGAPHSAPFSFVTMDSSVYFAAFTPSKGIEIWKTDGTEAGTVLLKDISVGSSSSIYEDSESFQNIFTVVNGNLYFGATSLASGYELWRSDGTAAGTILLEDVYAGSNSSYAYSLGSSSNLFLFTAYHPSFGTELWKSNGTTGGTRMVQDIYSGDEGSIFSKGAVLGNKFIFGGRNNFNGYEVLAYTLPAAPPVVNVMGRTDEEAQQASASAQSQIFKVYPNPANEVAYLEFFEKTAGETQVSILDISGKMVSQKTVSDADNVEINVADLPAGVYLVNVSNANRQESRKLVVQR